MNYVQNFRKFVMNIKKLQIHISILYYSTICFIHIWGIRLAKLIIKKKKIFDIEIFNIFIIKINTNFAVRKS